MCTHLTASAKARMGKEDTQTPRRQNLVSSPPSPTAPKRRPLLTLNEVQRHGKQKSKRTSVTAAEARAEQAPP